MSVRYPADRPKEGSDRYLDHAHNFLGSMAGRRVLEVGSGTGRFTERLLMDASEVTCVELSTRMIAHMKARVSDAHLDDGKLKVVCRYHGTVYGDSRPTEPLNLWPSHF